VILVWYPGISSRCGWSFLNPKPPGKSAQDSETLTEHGMAPRNSGAIGNPDLKGHSGAPGRGAFTILYLKVQDARIAAANYHTVGYEQTFRASLPP
jgi:hypothetical protein